MSGEEWNWKGLFVVVYRPSHLSHCVTLSARARNCSVIYCQHTLAQFQDRVLTLQSTNSALFSLFSTLSYCSCEEYSLGNFVYIVGGLQCCDNNLQLMLH